jgi:hypothetical protein
VRLLPRLLQLSPGPSRFCAPVSHATAVAAQQRLIIHTLYWRAEAGTGLSRVTTLVRRSAGGLRPDGVHTTLRDSLLYLSHTLTGWRVLCLVRGRVF